MAISFEPKPFQINASSQIVEKLRAYMKDPLTIKQSDRDRIVPFYQNLIAITGSGKTAILADVVEQARTCYSVEPIVLWLSKGRVVVLQTYTNLATGKYSEILGSYDIKPLLECTPSDVENSERGVAFVATVAKFNQKDKDQGDRKIFKVGLDVAEQSLWELLRSRVDKKGNKRPLLVVYDEGHNLSNQQTELLMELAPDALIIASATMKVPKEMETIINRFKTDLKWVDEDFITAIRSSDVVGSGLVKKHIMLGGYVTPMEIAVDELLCEMNQAEKTAGSLGLSIHPKAIYVSTTNAVDGSTIKEDMNRVFTERKARPILIWRHLVHAGIDPSEIAVYCDLKFDSKFPPDPRFNLFAGGDADYDNFTAGNFRHIIFNLSLQEGWDDPECAFAYIDKDMGSPDQVTQIIGRVLRQPGAQHYPSPILNTAHFYIRTDEQGVFQEILQDVSEKLIAETPEVTMTVRMDTKGGSRPTRPSLKSKEVPTVSINAAPAMEPIQDIVSKIMDFSGDAINVVGKGEQMHVLQTIGSGKESEGHWVEAERSNRVMARWVFLREVQKTQPKAVLLCDLEHPKFDVPIEYNSLAAEHIRDHAQRVVKAYIEHSTIVQNALDHPYVIDCIPVDESKMTKFSNALHEGYSGLNGFELKFAYALDKTKRAWCRNPSQGGYGIPLLNYGGTKTFNPDFLVWIDKDKYVIAIDTKGDHLIKDDSNRKLFEIKKVEDGPELRVRLVTEGEWHVQNNESSKIGNSGFTVWSLKQGKLSTTHCPTVKEAVKTCLHVAM
jgi:type III restriction enzyme